VYLFNRKNTTTFTVVEEDQRSEAELTRIIDHSPESIHGPGMPATFANCAEPGPLT
jgi:hypothetical protein